MSETENILSHSAFKNSKRCVALFRHLVHHCLAGESDQFKERTLGIEVFGRAPDYDTNTDPIVRMTANEIRKRLAQRYQETFDQTVKIRLVSGNYIPQFDFVREPPPLELHPQTVAEPLVQPPQASLPSPSVNLVPIDNTPTAEPGSEADWKSRRLRRLWWAGSCVLVLLLLAAVLYRTTHRAQDEVWKPILAGKESVTICVGEINAMAPRVASGWANAIARIIAQRTFIPTSPEKSQLPAVPLVDTVVAGRITNLLGDHHRQSMIRGGESLTLSDLRHGPIVLVGAFDNPWFLILLSGLRFHVCVDPITQEEWIEDAQNPTRREWKGSGLLSYADSSIDYALVTRVFAPETGHWVLAIGGLGMHGTEAAADLILDPAYASLLTGMDRSPNKNFQILIETSVIGGNTGPPRILAIHTW